MSRPLPPERGSPGPSSSESVAAVGELHQRQMDAITLLNLSDEGRSAFLPPDFNPQADDASSRDSDHGEYVQRYNERGYPVNPEARTEARRLRRAQNEVLSTVGLCVSRDEDALKAAHDSQAADRMKLEHVVTENEVGLAINAAALGISFLALWWTYALRCRLQAFRFYDGVPFWDIIRIEFKHFGFWKYCFAGMPVWLCSLGINMFRTYLLDVGFDWVWDKLLGKRSNENGLLALSRVAIFKHLNLGLWAATLPLHMLGYVQILNLLPFLAIPSVLSCVPFSRSSPIQLPPRPTSFWPGGIFSFGLGVIGQPVTLHFAFHGIRQFTEMAIYRRLRRVIVYPDNPDQLSLEASREDDFDTEMLPGIGWTRQHDGHDESFIGTVLTQFKNFHMWMSEKMGLQSLADVRPRLRPVWGDSQLPPTYVPTRPPRTSSLLAQQYPDEQSSPDSTTTPSPRDLFNLDEVFSNAGPDRPEDTAPSTLPLAPSQSSPPTRPRRTSTLTTVSTFPTSRAASPPPSPPPPHSVRVSAHPEDDVDSSQLDMGTLTRDPTTSRVTLAPAQVETYRPRRPAFQERINLPEGPGLVPPSAGPPRSSSPFTSDNDSSPPRSPESERQNRDLQIAAFHRVTTLSNNPPDLLASHLANLITNAIMVPFEGLLMRRTAHMYLSSHPADNSAASAATAMGLRRDVRGIGEFFGSPGHRLDYLNKLALSLAMQWQISSIIWMASMRFTLWIGRSWFGWGRL